MMMQRLVDRQCQLAALAIALPAVTACQPPTAAAAAPAPAPPHCYYCCHHQPPPPAGAGSCLGLLRVCVCRARIWQPHPGCTAPHDPVWWHNTNSSSSSTTECMHEWKGTGVGGCLIVGNRQSGESGATNTHTHMHDTICMLRRACFPAVMLVPPQVPHPKITRVTLRLQQHLLWVFMCVYVYV